MYYNIYVKSGKNNKMLELTKTYFLKEFVKNTIKNLLERRIINLFISELYENLGKYGEINKIFKISESEYLHLLNKNAVKIQYNEINQIILKQFIKMQENIKKYYCEYTEDIIDKNSDWQVPVREVGNRKKYFRGFTEYDKLITTCKYYILEIYTRGNQWTMIKQKEMEYFIKNNYIEMFASPFNARTKHFCSIFKTDAPFGSLGDFNSAFNKHLKYDNLIISLPSGYEIQNTVIQKVLKMLEYKKLNIYIGVSLKMFEYLKKSKYLRDFKVVDFCYDFMDKKYINMRGREWVNCFLSSKNETMPMIYPRESPYENPQLMENIKFSL